MSYEKAVEKFGIEAINKLVDLEAEPTGRLIYPSFEPEHANMREYVVGSVEVEGGKIYGYYFQPEEVAEEDDWKFGTMNGIQYGDIDNVEFIEE